MGDFAGWPCCECGVAPVDDSLDLMCEGSRCLLRPAKGNKGDVFADDANVLCPNCAAKRGWRPVRGAWGEDVTFICARCAPQPGGDERGRAGGPNKRPHAVLEVDDSSDDGSSDDDGDGDGGDDAPLLPPAVAAGKGGAKRAPPPEAAPTPPPLVPPAAPPSPPQLAAAAAAGDAAKLRRLLASHPLQQPSASDLSAALSSAVAARSPACVELLLAAHALPPSAAKGAAGATLLRSACAAGDHATVARLLGALVPANPVDAVGATFGGSEQRSPLWLAASLGHAECVEALLKANARATEPHGTHQPLAAAAAAVGGGDGRWLPGAKEALKKLLSRGAAPSATGPDGGTALHAACACRNRGAAKALLDHVGRGGDAEGARAAALLARDARRRTPLDVALSAAGGGGARGDGDAAAAENGHDDIGAGGVASCDARSLDVARLLAPLLAALLEGSVAAAEEGGKRAAAAGARASRAAEERAAKAEAAKADAESRLKAEARAAKALRVAKEAAEEGRRVAEARAAAAEARAAAPPAAVLGGGGGGGRMAALTEIYWEKVRAEVAMAKRLPQAEWPGRVRALSMRFHPDKCQFPDDYHFKQLVRACSTRPKCVFDMRRVQHVSLQAYINKELR